MTVEAAHICPLCLVEFRQGASDGIVCPRCKETGKVIQLMTMEAYLAEVDFDVVVEFWQTMAKATEEQRRVMLARIEQLKQRQVARGGILLGR